ncbi:Nuclear pore complex protein Nup155, partial [Spraguea lophii 42_110]
MKYKFFGEISKLEQENKLPYKYLYTSSSISYSNTNLIRLISDRTHPLKVCSIIHDSNSVYTIIDNYIAIVKNNIVYIYNYITNRIERLTDFTSNVIKVMEVNIENIKKEIKNIFIVITENVIYFYGINDDGDVVESEIKVDIEGKVTAVENNDNKIYIGYEDGRVEEIIYKNGFFSSPHRIDIEYTFLNILLPLFFNKVRSAVKSISLENKLLLVLSDKIRIYNNHKLLKEIEVENTAMKVKILENGFFYILHNNGRRDYYDNKFLFNRKPPIEQNVVFSEFEKEVLVTVSQKDHKLYNINIINLNEEQKVNHYKNIPLENYQLLTSSNFINITIRKNKIFIISENRMLSYEILQGPRFLLYSKVEDSYKILRGYGEKEAFINYLFLAGDGEDVTKLDHIFNKDNYIEAIYTYLYRITKNMYENRIDEKFFEKGDIVISRIKNIMKNRIIRKVLNNRFNEYYKNNYSNIYDNKEVTTLRKLISCIIESINYLKIVYEIDPSINDGVCLKDLIEGECALYKKSSFEKIINISTLENVLRKIKVKCSSFFPLNEIYYQKGMAFLKKANIEDLENALDNFMQIQISREDFVEDKIFSKRKIVYTENKRSDNEEVLSLVKVVDEFNKLRFYKGSVMIIRNIFGGLREGVELLNGALKCPGSLKKALADDRERFHFCVFEVVLKRMEEKEYTYDCICCTTNNPEEFNIINLNSPFLEQFLREKFDTSKNIDELELLYKYYLHNKKIDKGINSIISLVNKNIPTTKKIELLEIGSLINSNKEMNLQLTIVKVIQEIEKRTNQKIITSDPNELFNNYTLPLKYTDLSLQLLDISNYNNQRTIKDLWKEYLNTTYSESVNKLMRLRLTGVSKNLNIIGNILLEKIDHYNRNTVEPSENNRIINSHYEESTTQTEDEYTFKFNPTSDNEEITNIIR